MYNRRGGISVKKLNAIIAISLSVVLLCFFQNCDRNSQLSSVTPSPQGKIQESGDGSVFEGKLHFYAINPEKCLSMGHVNELVDSEIVKTPSGYRVLRQNCENLDTPEDRTDLFTSLNEHVLVVGEKIYEQLDQFPTVGVYPGDRIVALCTGSWENKGNYSRADSMVRAPRYEGETRSDNLIEAYVYGPRPIGEAVDAQYIQHYFGAARWDLSSATMYTARWVQRHKEVINGDPSTLAEFMSLGFLKPEYYKTDPDGEVRNGIVRVPTGETGVTFKVYTKCTDYR